MSSLPHQTAGLKDETPSTSDTAVGGNAGGNIVSNQSQSEPEKPSIGGSQSKPGSAEEAAEKLIGAAVPERRPFEQNRESVPEISPVAITLNRKSPLP
ncbi:hypothetical protein BST61_g4925 [Cercospora zeina]